MKSAEKTSEIEERKNRLDNIIDAGIDPYPAICNESRLKITDVLINFDSLESSEKIINCMGRVISKRAHGGLLFSDLKDMTGKIQLYIKQDVISVDKFLFFEKYIERGDFIVASGILTKTKRGEKSILLSNFRLLSKSLRPLPEKWHGLNEVETRYRKRELDLISNPEISKIFLLRHSLLQKFREFLNKENYVEVETPILQPIAGGAIAEPFSTHHNALNQDMFLRIAPELYLKRLIVGGLEKIFEVARCFRNEGIDASHNPEFTQIELYQAYADFNQLMEFIEQCIKRVVEPLILNKSLEYKNRKIFLKYPFTRITFFDSIKQHTTFDMTDFTEKELITVCKKIKVDVNSKWGRGKILDEVFKSHVRPNIIQPTFIYNHPIELSPLAKRSASDKSLADRFQLLLGGMEVVNAFSELNNPIEQRERFADQQRLRKRGDTEAHAYDATFLESLEFGMPPTAGLGIGIDRLMMLLTNTRNIKEVILFPTLRNKPAAHD